MQHIVVEPIRVGLPFTFALNFTGPGGAPLTGFDLRLASRLLGQFRISPEADGAPLASVDSANGSIVATDADTLSFALTAPQTAVMPRGGKVWLDFLRLDGATWSPVCGYIGWPVAQTITRPPA